MTGSTGGLPGGAAKRRRWAADLVVVLGALCLVLGVLAGYVNRVILDGDRFGAAVDEIRRDPAVSVALGRSLTDGFLQQQPDAVAVRPLIDAVATSVVRSDLLSGPTRAAAAGFARSLTEPSAQVFLLRVADAGAVVAAALQRVSPGTLSGDSQVPLQLASLGSQSFAGRTIALARFVGVAAWALPLSGVVLMTGGLLLAPRRRRAVLVGGVALLVLAGVLALGLLAGGSWASGQDDGTVRGALIEHGWPVLVAPAWWSVLAVAVVGLLVVAAAAALVPEVDPAAVVRRGWHVVAARPRRTTVAIVRAVALLAAGVFVVARPLVAVEIVGVLAGCGLALQGVHELAIATKEPGEKRDSRRSGRRVGAPLGAGALAVLVLVVTWGAMPSSTASASSPAAGAVPGRGEVCNGYAALCDRRYPGVAYAATHNSMATATDPGWFIPEQGRSIVGQLDHGVRALLVDVWPGFPTTQGRVATARSAYAEGKAQLERELGPEVVAAGLRVVDAVTNPTPAGPETLYLCHGLCEIGATAFQPEMADVKTWLDTHPDEVLTIIVEDHVPAAAIGAALTAAGLADYARVPPSAGQAWPTLRQMITSGRRLYVLLERSEGGTVYPWMANAYQHLVQETPYTAPTLADLQTCEPNRGRADAPLLLMNHWLSGFGQLVSSARRANAASVLGARAQLCRSRRQLPTFLAVNYADIGDVDAVVRSLNGVG